MKAKSIRGKSPEEIKTALLESIADGFKPSLAIVFVSVKQDRDCICKILDDENIILYGATTNGEFTEEGISEGEVAILLLDINRDYFTILFSEYPEKNYRETTQAMAKKALEKFASPAFLIAGSNLETDAEELLHGFEDIIGNHVNVFGGMAGDDMQFTQQFVFTNHQESNNGVVVLILNEDKLIIKGKATCGWKPMGTEKTVTKSEGNRVYSIENISPLEMTKKYSGLENLTRENETIGIEIATNFPLQLQREQGDPVMRPGLVVNWEDGSFICSGSVPQGAKIKFSLPPDFDVIEKVIKGCEELKNTEMPEADALVVFSCAGRLVSMGPMMGEEIEGVRKVWDVPMAGMFSNAELARATNGNLEMHNLTTCCVALKEK
ncbi:MAG: FIST N-terminal domain-containing protein [Ignavibacteria bacterium]